MATINFFVSAKKRKIAPVYVRLSAGRGTDLIVKSGLMVNPAEWSNKTQTIKQRIKTKEEEDFTSKLRELRTEIEDRIKSYGQEFARQWLESVIYQFHHKKEQDAKTLNEYIEQHIIEIEEGKQQTKSGRNVTIGTARRLRGFQRIFNEYQGVYTEKGLNRLKVAEKKPRPLQLIDFDNVTIDFYKSFNNFLSDEGYLLNTQGRFIKELKYFMNKSLIDKKHTNREFKEQAFGGVTEDSFTIYLTQEQIEKIYQHDLSHDKRLETARDKFIVLCETTLRVSDYDNIDINIRSVKGVRVIDLYQKKTGNRVIIPLTQRMKEILDKYNGQLPRIHENYVNKYIKTVAFQVGLTETVHWETTKYGKKYPKSAKMYELITCHSGRRSGATNMYLAGIPIIDIMKITGHLSEKTFMRYIRITAEETALRLSEHEYFNTPLRIAK